MLEEAVQAALGRGTDLQPLDARRARLWITNKHPGPAPLTSFGWVCQQLGLDEEAIRSHVLRRAAKLVPQGRRSRERRIFRKG